MTYEEFKEAVVDYAKGQLSDQVKVEIHSLTKNNGVVLDGLVIREDDINISPTIYLNNYYAYIEKENYSLTEILDSIMDCYKANKLSEDFDTSFMQDFSQVKDRLIYKLVNAKKNKDLLENVPHAYYMDLAMVFYYYMDELKITDGQATILITNKLLEEWKVSEEDIIKVATANTPRLLGLSVEGIVDTIKTLKPDMPEVEELEEDGLCSSIYVVSNDNKTNGASVICYKDSLLNLADRLESDLFVIPSSIHEVLIIPDKVMPRNYVKSLRDTIAFVNETEVQEQDILSDNLYFYSRAEDRLKIC